MINVLCLHPSLWFDHQNNIRKQFHCHDKMFQYVSKQQISQLLQIHQIFNKQLYRQVHTLRKQYQSYLKNIYLNAYIENIRQYQYNHYGFKYQQILCKIQINRFACATGKQMRILYNTLIENNSKEINKSILEFKHQQLLKLKQDLNNINIKEKEIQIKQTRGLVELNKKYQKNYQRLCQKIKKNPENSELYVQRGRLYQKQNKYSNAIVQYHKALKYNPNNLKAYFRRAYSYSKQNQNEKAIVGYTKAIQLYPNNYSALNNRGILYQNNNLNQKALHDYNEAIRIYPGGYKAYINRGIFYYNNNQFQKAIIDQTKSIQLNPQKIIAQLARANTYYFMDQYQKSLNGYSNRQRLKVKENQEIQGKIDEEIQKTEQITENFEKKVKEIRTTINHNQNAHRSGSNFLLYIFMKTQIIYDRSYEEQLQKQLIFLIFSQKKRIAKQKSLKMDIINLLFIM